MNAQFKKGVLELIVLAAVEQSSECKGRNHLSYFEATDE